MMARDPAERMSSPLAVIACLNDFVEASMSLEAATAPSSLLAAERAPASASQFEDLDVRTGGPTAGARIRNVLIVGPSPTDRAAWRSALEQAGLTCCEADRGPAVREAFKYFAADAALIDARIDGDTGEILCRQLRAEAPIANLKIVLIADNDDADDSDCGWDEKVARQSSPAGITARLRSIIRLKEAEERADRLAGHLLATNSQLEKAVRQRDDTTFQARDVLIFAMAKMAELRGQESGGHLQRMQAYVRVLAEQAQRLPSFARLIDGEFIGMLERCVLLHDIGKVAIPDHVLLKPGRLDPEERSIMESHTTVGASMLEIVARQHGASSLVFLQMAIDIVRHHHERWDGAGYPDGLSGSTIPLAARITMIADVYDAMRSKLVYKPRLSHSAVRRLMGFAAQGHFDPALLVAFQQCAANFEQIFEQTKD
jgi:putative two-component system response regulator